MTELSYFVVIFVHDQKVFLQVLIVLKCHCDENRKKILTRFLGFKVIFRP